MLKWNLHSQCCCILTQFDRSSNWIPINKSCILIWFHCLLYSLSLYNQSCTSLNHKFTPFPTFHIISPSSTHPRIIQRLLFAQLATVILLLILARWAVIVLFLVQHIHVGMWVLLLLLLGRRLKAALATAAAAAGRHHSCLLWRLLLARHRRRRSRLIIARHNGTRV